MRNFCLNLKNMAIQSLCVVALIAAACENDDTHQCPEPPTVVDNGAPVQAGDPVEATLSIGIRTADNSIHTYAAQPRAGRSVDDLWILEYGTDGTCLAAKKIGAYTLGEEIKVDLIAGTGVDLYAIAGAGETSFEGLSLDELKAAHWGGGIRYAGIASLLGPCPGRHPLRQLRKQGTCAGTHRLGNQDRLHS